MKSPRKIIMSIIACAMLVVTFATTTYAFVIINKEAEVKEFEFNLENETGILISLDGKSFTQDITADMIRAKIIENAGIDEDNFELLKYKGVSLKQDVNGDPVIGSNGPEFIHDILVGPTWVNGNDYYTHDYEDAVSSEYISFDIWLRAETLGTTLSNYEVYFNDRTGITGGISTPVTLSNSLATITGDYEAGDVVDVNPMDAMRISLYNYDDNEFTIYEPSIGLGSSAIEGSLVDKNNPNKNAMYTYYNSIHVDSRFEAAAMPGSAFDTKQSFTDSPVGFFENTDGNFNDIHLNVSIWLEGWDADYFLGIPESVSKFIVSLGFEIKETEHNFGAWGEYVKATCEETGLERRYCEDANCSHYEERVTEPTGHEYGDAQYSINADNTAYTAIATCKNSTCKEEYSGHAITETVAINKTVIIAPLCEADGLARYESDEFTNTRFEATVYELPEPAIGHKYGDVVYKWTEEIVEVSGVQTLVVKCTATKTCENAVCKEEHDRHAITETVEATYEIIEDATCLEAGYGIYTATFTADASFETQTKEVEITAKGHEYGDVVYTWNDNHTECTATITCTRTGCEDTDFEHVITETVQAVYALVTSPTTEAAGLETYTATFTNPRFEAQVYEVEIPQLQNSSGN